MALRKGRVPNRDNCAESNASISSYFTRQGAKQKRKRVDNALVRINQRHVNAVNLDRLVEREREEPFVLDIELELDEVAGTAPVVLSVPSAM